MINTVQINASSTSTLTEQLYTLTTNMQPSVYLTVNYLLDKNELSELDNFVQSQKPFPFSKLSLQVDLKTLQNPIFLNCLRQLNAAQLFSLELILPSEELQTNSSEIQNILTKTIAFLINYPLQVREQNKEGVSTPARLQLDEFQATVIANIQARNLHEPLKERPRAVKKHILNANDPLAKPIRLKTLIANNQIRNNNLAEFVQLEVQHIEAVEQQVILEEIIEEHVKADLQVIQQYSGQLIGYQEFCNPLYKRQVDAVTGNPELSDALYRLLRQELFANLPHAIKYLSPEAAVQLSNNLPTLVALNKDKDSLPNGFLLKITSEGEFVLDYDSYLENEFANPFRPRLPSTEITLEPIYFIELQEDDVRKWINDDHLFARLCPINPYQSPKQLINLWIRFAGQGVSSFFKDLKQAIAAQPDLIEFFFDNYLIYFPQWDHFYKNANFFTSLERISNYDEAKLICFKKFIKTTGSSRHDLANTVAAFDVFWNELNLLCHDRKVSINGINVADWATPQGGDPVVYMERMLFILNNARNLEDQLINLDKLTLDNYGAYYAARFEGFKSVSARMMLHYNAEEQDKQPFNKNFHLYRITLDNLYKKWSIAQKYAAAIEDRRSFSYRLIDDTDNTSNISKKPYKYFDSDHPEEFIPPYQLYQRTRNQDGTENWSLYLTSKPEPFKHEWFYALGLRFLGTQTEGITVSSFSKQFAELQSRLLGCGLHKLAECPSDYKGDDLALQNYQHAQYFLIDNETEWLYYYNPADKYLTNIRCGKETLQQLNALFGHHNPAELLTPEQLNQITTLTKHTHRVNFSAECLAVLFFSSHERYANTSLAPLFQLVASEAYLEYCPNSTYEETVKIIDGLNELYQLDIKLNELEGFILFNSNKFKLDDGFQRLRTCGLSTLAADKLMRQLQQNKFATFKFLNFHAKKYRYCPPPILFALDTADFLANDPDIAAVYRDDLLLFSQLANYASSDVYWHDQRGLKVEQHVKINLEKIKYYLHEAATQERPNNFQYGVETIIHSRAFFTHRQFLNAFIEINNIPAFDPNEVDLCLRKHGFKIGAVFPDVFVKDNADIKALMIRLILELDKVKRKQQPHEEDVFSSILHKKLVFQPIAELQILLEQLWQDSGILLSIVRKIQIREILKDWKDFAIKSSFKGADPLGLLAVIAERIPMLPDFQEYGDFEKIKKISEEAGKIAKLFSQVAQNSYVIEHSAEFVALFNTVNFSEIDYEILFAILSLLVSMPQRNYLSLLTMLFTNKDQLISKKEFVLKLVNFLSILDTHCFPSEYLAAFTRLAIVNPSEKSIEPMMHQMIAIYTKDNQDPLLATLMRHTRFTFEQITQIFNLTEDIVNNRDKLSQLFIELHTAQELNSFLGQLADTDPVIRQRLLEILGKGYEHNQSNLLNNQSIDYKKLITLLANLSRENFDNLYAFYKTNQISLKCLYHAFEQNENPDDFQHFLLAFEKAPFGQRDLRQQFSLAEVERVINNSKDLLNGSGYSYQYRKQLMEAFLFVNEIGQNLPVYFGKSAKDLSNDEIKIYFAKLKANQNNDLTPFHRRLLALGLIREVMYRTTGEFPYSTQIIALLDCIMHQGDFISNIDTGQGKSLIDCMKAALLWLDSDRVDYTTSSLVDAKRDIAKYGSLFQSLEIPYSQQPISSASSFENFQKNGINFSTFAQLSLFMAKANVMDKQLDTADTIVSLVINESDYAILDNRDIYRFAIANGQGIGLKQEWIYYAINEFVSSPDFIRNNKTAAYEDINDLKAYLKCKAAKLKKSGKIVDKFSDAQYLNWIESSLIVHYILKENKHYVIPEEMEQRVINGTTLHSKTVKLLMKDGKVSSDSTYGNGMQQLLYAYLNQRHDSADFIIEPQTQTIISSNNKNLLNYFRAKRGFIWGSSGTVGSSTETQEQYIKYGFEFSKTEPHQKNIIQYHSPVFEDNEEAQFRTLINQLTIDNPGPNVAPSVVFFKDIETAKRFYVTLENQNPKQFPLQCYLGLGHEEDYIRDAAKPSMITITTSALGRNTDIHYDKACGLRVWHTFVDSHRKTNQKSGRTGRQGSAGEVNFILNAAELGGKTIEQIKTEIDAYGALERLINERLYDILGYFMAYINTLSPEKFVRGKPAFLLEVWSGFSAKIEELYRERVRGDIYDKTEILNTALALFNQIIAPEIKEPVKGIDFEDISRCIDLRHPEKEKYNTAHEAVKITDCIAPITLAYHFLNFQEERDINKAAIKDRLANLFSTINQDNFIDINRNYIEFLTTTPANQQVIVECHKEFLSDYLQQQTKTTFFQRWFGYECKLNQIASNQHYLLMFHAFANLSKQPIIEINGIKSIITALLDNYLESSWFINFERREWAMALKEKISQMQDVDLIIQELSTSQIQATQQDIIINKNRLFKPLHYFHHSRYLTTLNQALNLATSLSGKTEVDPLIKNLTPFVVEVTDKEHVEEMSYDDFKHKASSPNSDNRMAAVILPTLENALAIKARQTPQGMAGRTNFFQPKPQDRHAQRVDASPKMEVF